MSALFKFAVLSEMSFFSESLMFQSPDPSELPVPNFEAGSKNTIIMARSYKSIDGEDNVGPTVEETSSVVPIPSGTETHVRKSVARNTARLDQTGRAATTVELGRTNVQSVCRQREHGS